MSNRVLAHVQDLFFYSKIRQVAQQLGLQLESADPSNLQAKVQASAPRLVVVELGSGLEATLAAVRQLKAEPDTSTTRILAFGSHVQADMLRQAQEAGCDAVLSKGEFTARLPQLLQS